MNHIIHVKLPPHLRTLARITGDLMLDVAGPVTAASVVDRIESLYPMLAGTIRDHQTRQRRPYVRFFAAGRDVSQQPMTEPLPESVTVGRDPLIILGAISGG